MAEPTDQEAALAYLKLHDDVKELVLRLVLDDLRDNPYGPLGQMVQRIVDERIAAEFQSLRVGKRGQQIPW